MVSMTAYLFITFSIAYSKQYLNHTSAYMKYIAIVPALQLGHREGTCLNAYLTTLNAHYGTDTHHFYTQHRSNVTNVHCQDIQ